MAEKITLSNTQLTRLQRGLKALDGVVEGKEIYRFDFDKDTFWHIVTNQVVVDRACDFYQIASKRLIEEAGLVEGEPLTAENREACFLYAKKKADLEQQTQELELTKLSAVDLTAKNQKHKIPPSVMVDLHPILEMQESNG